MNFARGSLFLPIFIPCQIIFYNDQGPVRGLDSQFFILLSLKANKRPQITFIYERLKYVLETCLRDYFFPELTRKRFVFIALKNIVKFQESFITQNFYDSAFIYLCSFVFQTSHICETYGIYLFLSDIPSRSIHVVADGKVSFFLWLIFHHVYISNHLYPFIYFFQVLATVNNAAMNLRVHISFCSSVFVFFG